MSEICFFFLFLNLILIPIPVARRSRRLLEFLSQLNNICVFSAKYYKIIRRKITLSRIIVLKIDPLIPHAPSEPKQNPNRVAIFISRQQ